MKGLSIHLVDRNGIGHDVEMSMAVEGDRVIEDKALMFADTHVYSIDPKRVASFKAVLWSGCDSHP